MKDALGELGDMIYQHLVNEMDCSEEELQVAIAEHRLFIGDIDFIDNEDGTSTMNFEARILEKPIENKEE